MKQCGYCGLSSEDRSFLCPFCGHRFPGPFVSTQALARVLITIVIPPIVWVVMTRLAGL
jgi:uncharacterized membrane protein YvbJ